MEKQSPRQNTPDEIDLAQFFRWIGKGFSNMGRSAIYFVAMLRNRFYANRVFFLGIIILGLILGAIYSEVLKKDYYKSTMVLSCDYLNTQILKNTIEKFNLLAGERDTEGIQEMLKIDSLTAKNIQKFEFKSFVSEDDVVEMEVLREQLNSVTGEKQELVERVINRLEIQNKNAYEISVFVYDPGIVKQLEAALVTYFSSNDYIKRRIEINRINLENRKAKLEDELRKLDSLKGVLFRSYHNLERGRGSNNVVVAGEETNPLEIFNRDMEFHGDLQDVNRRLYLTPDFEVVEGLTSFREPESASLPDVLAISILISIIMGYLILGAYKFDRMLAKYPTK